MSLMQMKDISPARWILRRCIFFVAVGVALSISAAQAQVPVKPSAANGEMLARRWCASCHIVAKDQKSGSSDVPTFASIGGQAQITPEGLALFLLTSHPRMPDMALSRREVADLVAYILTQRP